MTASPHQFQIQPIPGVNTASPNDPSFLRLIDDALAGGPAVYDFFAGHYQALQDLYETIATGGDEVWIDGTDTHTGLPVSYVAQGTTFLTVASKFTDTGPLQDGTGGTTTYKPVGISYVTFTTDQGTSQLILNAVHYAGMGIGTLMTAPVLAKIAISLIKSLAKFIKNLAVRIYTKVKGGADEDPGQASDTVENEAGQAAEDSTIDGADLGGGLLADVTISVAQGVLFVVGLGILAVVFILQLISKQISAQVRFYNLTAIDVSFGVCRTQSKTAMSGGPAAVGTTAVVPKVSAPVTPPWIISTDTGIYYAEAQFVNSNELYGIGYVLEAEPTGDFPGFRVLVDIPNVGDNSLALAFTDTGCDGYWSAHEVEVDEGTQDVSLTASATSGTYTLRLATNANHGRTPSPLSGANGYNYEHLLVLTDGSVT